MVKKFKPFHKALVDWLTEKSTADPFNEFKTFEIWAVCELAARTYIPRGHREEVRSVLKVLSRRFVSTSAGRPIREALASLRAQDKQDR